MPTPLELARAYGGNTPQEPEQSAPSSNLAAHLASGEGRITPDWMTKGLQAATLAALIPGGQGISAVGAVGLGATEGLEAVRSYLKGDTSDAALSGIVSVLGLTGAGNFFRGLLRAGVKNPAVKEAVTKLGQMGASETGAAVAGAKGAAKGAKAAQAAATATTGAKAGSRRFAPVAGEKAELRRGLRESRLAARALTRAGKEVPEALTQDITTNARIVTEQARKAALKAAAERDPLIAGQRQLNKAVDTAMKMAKSGQPIKQLDAFLTPLLRRAGMTDDVITAVREGLAKQAPTVKGRKAKAASEAGFAAAELLARFAAPAAGAVAGGAAGSNMDIPEREQWEKVFMGAAAGALAGGLAGGAGAAYLRGGGKEVLKSGLNFHQFAMLASHKTTIRANLGSLSAVLHKAAFLASKGEFAKAGAGLRTLLDAPKIYAKAFANPNLSHLPAAQRQQFWATVGGSRGLMSFPSRAIAAGDAVATKAIVAMGGTKEEAMRMALSGTPRIGILRDALNLVDDVVTPGGKTLRAKHSLTRGNTLGYIISRYMVPFARPRVQLVEQAIEHSPFGLLPGVRQALGNSLPDAARKTAIGSVANLGLGAGLAHFTSPELDSWTAAAGGPNALMVAAGQHLARGAFRDQDAATIAQKIFGEFPLVAENISVNPAERFVPSMARDFATTLDPAFGREKGFGAASQQYLQEGGEFGSLGHLAAPVMAGPLARIPVLRESLPERPMPIDNFGQPKFPDRPMFIPDVTLRGDSPDIILPKFLTAAPMINPPDYARDDELSQQLRELEKRNPSVGPIMQPPSAPSSAELEELEVLGGPEIDEPHRDVRLAALDAKGSERRRLVEAFMVHPAFQSIPEPERIVILRNLVDQLGSGDLAKNVGKLTAASQLAPERRQEVINALRTLASGMK